MKLSLEPLYTFSKTNLFVMSGYSQFFMLIHAVILYVLEIFSGMLHGLTGFLFDAICCRYKLGKYSSAGLIASDYKTTVTPVTNITQDLSPSTHIPTTSLIKNDNSIIQNPLLNLN